MTKLFSVKSLAFAGAAAFALTLAAAPEADAKVNALVDYNEGTLTIDSTTTSQLKQIDGEYVVYVQAGKKITDNKYVAISSGLTSETTNTTKPTAYQGAPMFDISKLIGTTGRISISTDGTIGNATSASIKAAPKVKAKYDTKEKKINLTGDITGSVASGSAVTSATKVNFAAYKIGAYGNWTTFVSNGAEDTDGTLAKALSSLEGLGNTIYLRVAAQDTPCTKEIKVKIPGKAKAPNISLKLNSKKAFGLKITNKQEYKVISPVASIGEGDWKTGTSGLATWTEIAKNSLGDTNGVKVASGDAILTDITLAVRTAATDKKPASAIKMITLKKSADSPTSTAVEVNVTEKYDNIATSASITAKKNIQYTLDGITWIDLAAGKTKNLKDTANGKDLLVRIPGDNKQKIAPSLNTRFNVDYNAGTVNARGLQNDGTAGNTAITDVNAK